MKPFDLEKALTGAPVITRDGREVTQLHLFDAEGTKYPLYGVIKDGTCGTYVECFAENGVWRRSGESGSDLFMKTVKKVGYVFPGDIADIQMTSNWVKVEYEE